MLNLDFWSILFTIINLLVFFLIIKFFLLKPVKAKMDERQELVNNEISQAEEKNIQAEKLKAEYESDLQNAKEEAYKITAEAKKSAQSEYDRIVDKAGDDAKGIILDAKDKASKEHDKAMEQLQSEIASLALVAATKVLKDGSSSYSDLNTGEDNE